MKKNTAEGFIEKGAVDGIVVDKGGYGSDFRGGCNNGADEVSKTCWYKV
jgi:hypothetical protein